MKNIIRTTAIAAFLGFATNASANLITIDFEGEAQGPKPNGYTTAGAPGVAFSDTVGANLDVDDYGVQGLGQRSLAVNFDDDAGGLRIDLAFIADALALDFGNDDPGFTAAGDIAYLEVFLSNVSVGTTSVVMNRDDVMNQTISIAGVQFDSAFFLYTDPDLSGVTNKGSDPIGLIEIVDDIKINRVPEPATLALLAAGLLGARVRGRSRQ